MNSGSSPDAPASEKCVIRYLPSIRSSSRGRSGPGRRRVEQHPHRLLRLRAERDDATEDLLRLTRGAIDVEDAVRPMRCGIHEHLVGHRTGHERASARRHRVRHRRECRVEVRVRDAAVLARTAVMTRLAAVDRPREIGGAALRDRAAELRLDAGADRRLGAGKASAAGRGRRAAPQSLPACRDADVLLDEVVVGRDVGVGDRPVDADAVVRRGLEVDVAQAEAGASPDVRAAADDARADPEELRIGLVDVRLVDVVDVPVGIPLADGVRPRLTGRSRSSGRLVRPGIPAGAGTCSL